MISRQKELARILAESKFVIHYPVFLNKSVFYSSSYHNVISDVYKSLGGVLHEYPTNFGSFDIILDNCDIELDEENHFNRYRRITLEAPIYQNNKYVPAELYKLYCVDFEHKGGRTGNFWSSPSCETQFGKSTVVNDFSGNGPARWKQRAFYDFLKDVYSFLQDKSVFRISTYESAGKSSINSILKRGKNTDLLIEHIKNRIFSI